MIRTTWNPARAARLAAARTLRHRVRAALVRFLNGARKTALLAAGELVTVSAHLARLGADETFIGRFGSVAGKAVKKAFLAATGCTPETAWKLHRGRVIEVAVYPATDPALNSGVASYARTAHLINA